MYDNVGILEVLDTNPSVVETLDWDCLPAGLVELKEMVGPAAAVQLARAMGGNTVYVPATPKEGHQIVALIGMDKALDLAAVYGGDRLSIPKVDAVLRQIRLDRIRERRSQGASVPALAAEFNLTRRRVHQILAAA